MDATEALKAAENVLRDFISVILSNKYGSNWIEKCGVSIERINKWHERMEVEVKRQNGGVVEQRILYYADFYDLNTILKKNWEGPIAEALGDYKTMDVWLSELEKLRDPDAHSRELLPHQKYLILGISGEIRNRLVRYRSKQETSEDYFPRIESVRDSVGNICSYGNRAVLLGTKTILRPGDKLDYVIIATDPFGEPIEYRIFTPRKTEWQAENVFSLTITENDIKTNFTVMFEIKSKRKYHANNDVDDTVLFQYTVLPPPRKR